MNRCLIIVLIFTTFFVLKYRTVERFLIWHDLKSILGFRRGFSITLTNLLSKQVVLLIVLERCLQIRVQLGRETQQCSGMKRCSYASILSLTIRVIWKQISWWPLLTVICNGTAELNPFQTNLKKEVYSKNIGHAHRW